MKIPIFSLSIFKILSTAVKTAERKQNTTTKDEFVQLSTTTHDNITVIVVNNKDFNHINPIVLLFCIFLMPHFLTIPYILQADSKSLSNARVPYRQSVQVRRELYHLFQEHQLQNE